MLTAWFNFVKSKNWKHTCHGICYQVSQVIYSLNFWEIYKKKGLIRINNVKCSLKKWNHDSHTFIKWIYIYFYLSLSVRKLVRCYNKFKGNYKNRHFYRSGMLTGKCKWRQRVWPLPFGGESCISIGRWSLQHYRHEGFCLAITYLQPAGM